MRLLALAGQFAFGASEQGASPQIFQPTLPTGVKLDVDDGFHATGEEPLPDSFAKYVGERGAIEDIEAYIDKFGQVDIINNLAREGRVVLSNVFAELYTFLYYHALRVMETDPYRAVEDLHRAARMVEVLYPRSPMSHREEFISRYLRVTKLLHKLVFQIRKDPPEIHSDSFPLVDVAITCVGESYGRKALPTINSLLHYSSTRIRLWVVADLEGWNGFLKAPEATRWEYRDTLSVEFVNVWLIEA